MQNQPGPKLVELKAQARNNTSTHQSPTRAGIPSHHTIPQHRPLKEVLTYAKLYNIGVVWPSHYDGDEKNWNPIQNPLTSPLDTTRTRRCHILTEYHFSHICYLFPCRPWLVTASLLPIASNHPNRHRRNTTTARLWLVRFSFMWALQNIRQHHPLLHKLLWRPWDAANPARFYFFYFYNIILNG